MVLSPGDIDLARPPPGFVYLPPMKEGDFNALVGPWFAKDEGGRLVAGFRVLAQHQNPAGDCHGGMIASVFDVFLAMAAIYQGDIAAMLLPTVSLSVDFLAPTPGGAWVEARAELLRAGRRLVFIQGMMTVDGRATARANGVFNVPATPTGDSPSTAAQMRALLRPGAA